MSATLTEMRVMHAEMIEEARASFARAEKFGRMLEELERKAAAKAVQPPIQVEYDRSQLEEAPRAKPPLCGCDEPSVYKSGTGKTGKPWAAFFCAKRPNDPNNCGYRQWVD